MSVDDIFLNYPLIDLHGYDRESAIVLVKDFILENYKLGNRKIIIIHGKGEGILKNAVHDYLKLEKIVENYKLNNFNLGMTIVELR